MDPIYAHRFLILWQHRKPLLKTTAVGLLLGLLLSFLLPKEYEARMLIAAESTAIPDDEAVGSLAVENFTAKSSTHYDALRPSLYPDIFTSTVFLDSLAVIPVQTVGCPPDSILTLREYLLEHQRRLFPLPPDKLIDELRKRIDILPDEKTRTVALACRMQDPLVAATVLDTLARRIRQGITEYRTRKEREELAAAKRLQEETREKYYQAQEAQAAFEDRNRALATKDAQKEAIRLRILTRQAREAYARATLQVHAAETQVIRVRPVFAVIQPPTVPVRPVSPSKLRYMAGFALLGLAVGVLRVLFFQYKKTLL